jgi:SAM-dependent methyltransferase
MKQNNPNLNDHVIRPSGERRVHSDHFGRRHREDPLPFLKRIGVHQGLIVADLGCGEGYYSIPLATLVRESGMVYAVDQSANALSALQEKVKDLNMREGLIKTVQADATKTDIPGGSIDIVFLANMFHNVVHKEELVDEIKRLLKPSGVVVDIDWMRIETPFGPPYALRVSDNEIRGLFIGFGFTEVSYFIPDKYHYCLVFRKQDQAQDDKLDMKNDLAGSSLSSQENEMGRYL